MRDHDERNRLSRERLASLTARMDADALRRPLGEHWTIAAGLLHLSFWDRFVLERWKHAEAHGLDTPAAFDALAEDRVNDTLTRLLILVPPEESIGQALEAALAVEQLIAGLSTDQVTAVESSVRPRLVDRSIHRSEHLDEIDAALG